jgi:hypothetical protein
MMSDWLARWLQKPDVPIADFIVPLPIEVCIERLYSTRIKYVYTTVELKSKSVDANSYVYDLRMVNQPLYKGSGGAVTGTLQWQSDQTTRVIVMHEHTPSDLKIWEVMVVVTWFIFIGTALTSGPICIMFSIFVVFMLWGGSNRDAVRLIREALAVPQTNDKAKNDVE